MRTSRRRRLLTRALAAAALALPCRAADGEPPHLEPDETPRAGQAFQTEVLGQEVEVERRDRGDVMALALGATAWLPEVGDTSVSPLGSFYWFRDEGPRRLRTQISLLVNDVEGARRFGAVELIGRLVNDHSRVFGHPETIGGEELEETELAWGHLAFWLGSGLALDVPPFRVENALRLQAFYRVGFEHYDDTDATSDRGDVLEPPNTLLHGPWLRLRMDRLERNLLELPHHGYAFGLDASVTRRDRTAGADGIPGFDPLRDAGARDHAQVSGYGVAVTGVPGLDERHRLRWQIDAGFAPDEKLDRFSAFRLGGGPLPKESNDLVRSPYAGTLFDQLLADRYVLVTAAYRFQLVFFTYLEVGTQLLVGNLAALEERTGDVRFRTLDGQNFNATLTTGFLFESTVDLQYAYETRLARGDEGGHQVLLLWSKEL